MPEIKKVFLRGKMNKDLDERLLPDGEYRDAKNIQVSSTESSDAGTVQNILGNRYAEKVGDNYVAEYNLGGSCIGIIENPETEKIYLFIKGTSVNAIVEYDESKETEQSRPVLIDARTGNTENDSNVLNFTNDKLTGVAILQDYLVFTDNNSEPKIVDISNDSPFIAGSTDYTTTTKLNNINFKEEDITLIRRKPSHAPRVRIDYTGTGSKNSNPRYEEKFVRFAYRWKFNNGQYSAISPFSEPVFMPSDVNNYDINEGYNNQMLNNITGAFLYNIETDINNLEYVDIIYKESNNTNIYLYTTLTKSSVLGSEVSVYEEVKKTVLPEDQLLRAYDNVPFRAKAVDIVGNRIVFGNYKDGINVEGYTPTFSSIQLISRTWIEEETARKVLSYTTGLPITGAIGVTSQSVPDMATVKTGRTYEIGLVFEDKYGRQTPVITAGGGSLGSGTKKIDFDTGDDFGKKFRITMGGSAPSDSRIKKFKYYIKTSSNNYNNIIVEDIKKDLEDSGTCWLVVPSYEINKINEGQYMMLKKALNTDAPLTYTTPDNFKFKALDISSGKPENIDASETFDGKFFIKIKKTTEINNNLFNNQGLAGSNGEVADSDFKLVYSVPYNALFLGEVQEPHEDNYYSYYLKDGNVYEVLRTIPTNYTVDQTFQTSKFSGSSIGSYVDMANYTGSSTFLGPVPFTDSTGEITQREVKFNSAGFPTDFRFTYQAQNTGVTTGSSPAVFETIPEDEVLDIYYETSQSFPISEWGQAQDLAFHNAFVMGNGVESSIIRDDFNEDRLDTGVKVSTTIDESFTERIQKNSLIYSGIFNSESNLNKLNEFNTALKITKELNPEYGSIQKLHTRDTDLIALCEDKVLRILANKDALFNADGNVNLTATENVLGQAIAYNGDYGISQNPESFAHHGYRTYFTDKARGAVIRLSKDGITVISSKGMTTFFRENLLEETGNIIGSYDVYSKQYILSLPEYGRSISFKEDVDGWVSTLTFIPDGGVSLNGNYYTCYNGELYLHHASSVERNTFYGAHDNSGLKLIFNQEPSTIKNFKNLSYEGTTSWSVDSSGIVTDQQDGEIIEFKEKEGKYFGLISGIETELDSISASELDSRLKDFSIQGLGNISSHSGTLTFGCANAGLTINSGTVGQTVTGTVTAGTIESISPSTYQTGTNPYTATILVPSGYDNSGSTIDCSASAGATSAAFTCTDANLQIADGTVGATVSGTVDLGTIASYSPNTYTAGAQIYTATINIPSGYSNSGTIDCTDTATGSSASCGLSLSVGTYSAGGTTLTGTFSGTDYVGADTIALTVNSGTISPTTTTKSALAAGLAVTLSEGVTITATITSGLCNGTTATIQAPQSATVVINGNSTALTYDQITLTASTTGTVTSYQWYKDTNSGFTPGSGNIIANETNSTLQTSETAADTIYYKVKINGTTDSAQHTVVWSNRTAINNLKFIFGSSANPAACTSATLKDVFANGSFTSATQFYSNIQGSLTGFSEGTYSDGTDYRFISSGGVPTTATTCGSGGTQGIRASKCNDSSFDRYFDVDLDGNNTLSNGDVISFTTQQFSNDYWYVEDASYSGGFDASPTLANTHSSCTLMLTPTVDVTSPVAGSFIYESGSLKTRTLSAASRSNEPQGAAITYQWKGGTAANSLSNISGATSETLNVDFNTVSNSVGQPTYYNCDVIYTDGGDTKTVTDPAPVYIIWNNFPSYTLNYVNAGSSSSPSVDACTNTSDQRVLYGNSLTSLATTTQFYSNANGSTGGISTGTYSDGSKRAYVNGGNGNVVSTWQECTTFEITGSTSSSSYATVILTANETGFAGTNFRWTADNVEVQNGSSNTYAATVSTTFSGNVTYGCTVTGGTASGQFDSHQITWSIPSQDLAARLCPNGVSYNFRITNAAGYTNGQVLNLTGGGFTDGCYEITNASYSGSIDYSAEVAGSFPFQPSSSCCDCTGCSVSVSGVGAVEINTSTTLTAVASGFSPTGYQWQSSTDNSNFTNISGATSATVSVTSGSAGSIYYRVIATATGVTQTSSSHAISWYAPAPTERWYQAEDLQSDCTTAANQVITVRYTSVNALSNGTVFEAPDGNVTTCYTITGSGSGDSTAYEIQTFHNSCIACQNANQVDCSFSLSTSGNYNSSNGTATVTGTFGSGHTGTVSVGFGVSSGTVSPTSATKSALQSGVTLTLSPGVTLTGTISGTGPCTGDQATVQIPQSTCNSVAVYYTNNNPVTDTTAAGVLCGAGSAKSLYINGTTLANSTQVYTAAGCGTLMSGTKYYSTDNSNYYIWNGTTLSGPYTLNCP
jgi:hypothetical protein